MGNRHYEKIKDDLLFLIPAQSGKMRKNAFLEMWVSSKKPSSANLVFSSPKNCECQMLHSIS